MAAVSLQGMRKRFVQTSDSFREYLDDAEQAPQSKQARLDKALEDQLAVSPVDEQTPHSASNTSDTLHLNVGGDINFVTKRDTLSAVRGSRLAQLFSGRWDRIMPRDSEGRIFLDLDPRLFRALLNWLVDLKRIAPGECPTHPPTSALPAECREGFDAVCECLCLCTESKGQAPTTRNEGAASDAHSANSQPSEANDHGQDSLILDASCLQVLGELLESAPACGEKALKLLYRATRDGFANQTFHEKCDAKGPTLVVARSVGGRLFGGYTETPWDSSGSYKSCRDAFLFSLPHPGNALASKHIIHQSQSNGIYCHPSQGPTFGGGHDMRIYAEGPAAKAAFSIGNTYNPAGTGGTFNFLAESQNVVVTDWEVFEVSPVMSLTGAIHRLLADTQRMKLQMQPDAVQMLEKTIEVSVAALAYGHSLKKHHAVLESRCRALDGEVDFMHRFLGVDASGKKTQAEIVRLNVSGIAMETFRSTLTFESGSTLAAKFGDSWTLQGEELVNGGVFFDEDPELFSLVLQHLRLSRLLGKDACPNSLRVPPLKCAALNRLLQYLGMDALTMAPMETEPDALTMAPMESELIGAAQERELVNLLGDALRGQQGFKLLYRASRDGFANQTFHEKCDAKGPTLVVARSVGGRLFGGYTETPWDSSGSYKSCRDAFLFSLPHPGNASASKHIIHQSQSTGIYCDPSYGPTFGCGHDMWIYAGGPAAKAAFLIGRTYNQNGTGGTFTFLAESQNVVVTDLEVFEIS